MGRASGQIDFHVAMGIAIRVGVQFEHIKSARPSGDAPERAKMECFTILRNHYTCLVKFVNQQTTTEHRSLVVCIFTPL